jgi:2-amino-4-hydroxy-6-hydroxymethyldihydropteridine diphosphokinase
LPLKRVFLALGSNLGERKRSLESAIGALEAANVRVVRRSAIYETEPQEFKDQPWFLNMALEAETTCFPVQLLTVLQRIERELGRIRGREATPNGPRTIDIDILVYGKTVLDGPRLIIPHPRMRGRRFVLEPLMEIAPDLRHPGTGRPFAKDLALLTGQQTRRWGPEM